MPGPSCKVETIKGTYRTVLDYGAAPPDDTSSTNTKVAVTITDAARPGSPAQTTTAIEKGAVLENAVKDIRQQQQLGHHVTGLNCNNL